VPTIKEVYEPLIQAALSSDEKGHVLLDQLGQTLYELHPEKCSSKQEGLSQAKINLDYYCQYYPEETSKAVKRFYNLGKGFRSLIGVKLPV
jgi:hypothetical protein